MLSKSITSHNGLGAGEMDMMSQDSRGGMMTSTVLINRISTMVIKDQEMDKYPMRVRVLCQDMSTLTEDKMWHNLVLEDGNNG